MAKLELRCGEPAHERLTRARGGDARALEELLGLYRNYLRLLARGQIGAVLGRRLEASDLVQDTLLEAYRDFARFQGTSERELVAWLRRILVRNLADQARHFEAQKRGFQEQESLEALLDRSSLAVHKALAEGILSPSALAAKREQAVLLADALEKLPEDYREVLILRHLERLSFEEVAARLGRTNGAVRKIWTRALVKLRLLLKAAGQESDGK